MDRLRRDLLRRARLHRRGQEPLRQEPVYRRRRRVALAAIGGVALLVVVVVAVLSAGGGDEAPAPIAAPAPPECVEDSEDALRRRLGARIVVRMESRATPALLRQARRGEIGGVVLFPPEDEQAAALAPELERLQAAAAEGGHGPLVVATDQEGGLVKRFASLPPDAAPPELAGDPEAAAAEGAATGEALAGIGVNVDLAPVLDVPESADSFVAERAYGSAPAEAAAAGTEFATGLQAGGVAATAKHFPGLGRSAVNTDEEPSEVDATRAELLADLEPFERAIGAGIDLVMLSNATYPALDPRAPAFASPAITEELLRGDLGFEGVTITDDLEAGAVRASYDRSEAAIAAAAGGSDLLLFALSSEPDVLDELMEAAQSGELPAAATEASCLRVGELRASLG